MIATVVGILFILAGLLWAALAVFAASFASRPVDAWREVFRPALLGLAVLSGIGLLLILGV